MVEVELAALRVQLPTNTPVVLLREVGGQQRTLQILIGQAEATAIALVLQHVDPPRPMTHDLMRILLETLATTVDRVVITELVGHTYYADIHLNQQGRTYTVSARPSDAIALAIRTGSPIYTSDELMEQEGEAMEIPGLQPAAVDEEAVVRQFKHFIDEVRPEDFAS